MAHADPNSKQAHYEPVEGDNGWGVAVIDPHDKKVADAQRPTLSSSQEAEALITELKEEDRRSNAYADITNQW